MRTCEFSISERESLSTMLRSRPWPVAAVECEFIQHDDADQYLRIEATRFSGQYKLPLASHVSITLYCILQSMCGIRLAVERVAANYVRLVIDLIPGLSSVMVLRHTLSGDGLD